MGDGFMGGVQATAVQSLREAAAAGEKASPRSGRCVLPIKTGTFTFALASPVWAALAMEGRLSDVVVFDFPTARGKGALSEAFQQILADEQRPTLVAHDGLTVGGPIAVAWDGGKEASRAVRTSIPLLRKASTVVILSAPAASPRRFDPALLQRFLGARGVEAAIEVLKATGMAIPPPPWSRRPRSRVGRDPGGGRVQPPAPAGICVRRRHADVPQLRRAVPLSLPLNPAGQPTPAQLASYRSESPWPSRAS